jgi:signal transduction histidine kinase/CheY-like chemotaxis protein
MTPPFDALAVLDGLMDPVVVLNRAEEIVYANQAFHRVSGCPEMEVAGKRLAEAWPATRSLLDHACYLHSACSGESGRFVLKFSEAADHYEIALQPLSGSCIAIGLRDYCDHSAMPAESIDRESPNESSHAILHSRMLAHMGTCLRADFGAAETFYQMACILGQLPEVSRATFGTVDHELRSITIHRDFCRNVPSMAGTYRMSDAEITCQELSRGQIVVITDVRSDYRTIDGLERRYKLGYMACVAVPLMRDTIWAATLMVHSPVPRDWSTDEVELIRTAAERTWFAVENARLLQEARQANAAKDRFLAMLSHELRTPLTPVVMMLSALQLSDRISAEVKNDLAMIRRNIDLETRLIDDLLDTTRIAHGKLQLAASPVRVHELLEHVSQMCKDDARNGGIELICQFAASCDAVEGDPTRLEQVFWNLLKNAIKFTPPGGSVCIITRDGDGEVLVAVKDSGAGIAPEVLPHIFNPFEQGEDRITRTFGGLGLGLTICKAIVDLHGGRIWARSDGLKRGSELYVALPLTVLSVQEHRTAKSVKVGDSDSGKGQSLRILLVDDNADTLGTMQWLLTFRGMQVTTAMGVREALGTASKAKYDLMISDIGLPDGSGYELVEKMQQLQPLPAIALSGYGTDSDVKRSLKAGFTAHLVKPVSFEHLEKVIAEIV